MKLLPPPPFLRKRKTVALVKRPNASRCTASVSGRENYAHKTAIVITVAMTKLMSIR